METIYVGRQPIFDKKLDVYAYELLFRGGHRPTSDGATGDHATVQVLVNAVMEIGLEAIVGTRRAFVNLTTGFLDGSYPLPLCPERVALEILEDVAPTEAVLNTLRDLKRRGYILSLDDFVYRPELEPLLRLADMVKLDVLALSPAEVRAHVALLRRHPVKLVAEKVETYDDYRTCLDLGFDLFQGFFLAKPQVVEGVAHRAHRTVVFNLISRLQDPNADLEELESLIVQDTPLTLKLLRHVNSASFALRREVESVREALIFLGTQTVRNWACLILLTRLNDKPLELVNAALVRAKMCEELAKAQKVRTTHAYFTTGLFSLLDAFMDRPLEELITPLPLTQGIKQALLTHEGHLGETLQQVVWYESAAWEKLDDGQLDPDVYTRSYMEALQWANASAHLLDRAA